MQKSGTDFHGETQCEQINYKFYKSIQVNTNHIALHVRKTAKRENKSYYDWIILLVQEI